MICKNYNIKFCIILTFQSHALVVVLLHKASRCDESLEACHSAINSLPSSSGIIQELMNNISDNGDQVKLFLNCFCIMNISEDNYTTNDKIPLKMEEEDDPVAEESVSSIPSYNSMMDASERSSNDYLEDENEYGSASSDIVPVHIIANLIQMANSSEVANQKKNVREQVLREKSEHHISDDQLLSMTVREMNIILTGVPDIVSKILRQRRRTLKNRGYALSCRLKKKTASESLKVN